MKIRSFTISWSEPAGKRPAASFAEPVALHGAGSLHAIVTQRCSACLQSLSSFYSQPRCFLHSSGKRILHRSNTRSLSMDPDGTTRLRSLCPASDETAKEGQLLRFHHGSSIVSAVFRHVLQRQQKACDQEERSFVGLSLIGTAGYYGAYVILYRKSWEHSLIAHLPRRSFANRFIQRLLLGASDIYQQCLYLKDLFDFLKCSQRSQQFRASLCHSRSAGVLNFGCGLSLSRKRALGGAPRELPASSAERIALVGENRRAKPRSPNYWRGCTIRRGDEFS